MFSFYYRYSWSLWLICKQCWFSECNWQLTTLNQLLPIAKSLSSPFHVQIQQKKPWIIVLNVFKVNKNNARMTSFLLIFNTVSMLLSCFGFLHWTFINLLDFVLVCGIGIFLAPVFNSKVYIFHILQFFVDMCLLWIILSFRLMEN